MGNIVTMGDVRSPMAKEGRALIDKAINVGCSKGYKDFWVALRARVDPFASEEIGGHVIRSMALILTPGKYRQLRKGAKKFEGWIDSLCVHVVKGDMVEVITRPKDLPTAGIPMSEVTNERISETAQRLNSPLAY
ncbi:MAG TPA: hypothetical protein ENH62_13295 [Marinobacter sp.]|uniref:Uncharacterized protein n=1 Tax=marine sediment metagenome TaxID=412755 RepID=A0A0F9NH23_9ZZZZ|nr:hypothetical protein [Marinobacter sp.]